MGKQNKYSDIEMMVISGSREIKDGELVCTGTFWPLLAVCHAKKCHAPNIITIFEAGIIRDLPTIRIPLLSTDTAVMLDALWMGDCFDTLGMVLHAGQDQISFLSAASIDKFGNINTTCIGDYDNPDFRLAGSGGANDFGTFAKRLIILIEHDKRRFQEKVDYITTPGYLQGGRSREEAGMRAGTGPEAVISTMGIFRFDQTTKEMYLAGYFPGRSINEIKENVQWDLKIANDIFKVPPPTEEELHVLRKEVDPKGMFLRDQRERDDW